MAPRRPVANGAKHPNYRRWTEEELVALHTLFPAAPLSQIEDALPDRSWVQIRSQATARGLRRPRPPRKHPLPKPVFVVPIVAELRRMRKERRISRVILAAEAGYSAHSIHKWEEGHAQPLTSALIDWAQALGYRLVLVPDREP